MHDPESLNARLESLERRCRRLRLWCVGLTALLTSACLAAAVGPSLRIARAERFEVVDREGHVRGVLGLDAGNVVLAMRTRGSYVGLRAGVGEDSDPAWPYGIEDALASHEVLLGSGGEGFADPRARGFTSFEMVAQESSSDMTVDGLGATLDLERAWTGLSAGAIGVYDEEGFQDMVQMNLYSETGRAEGPFNATTLWTTDDGGGLQLVDDVEDQRVAYDPESGGLRLNAEQEPTAELRADSGEATLRLRDSSGATTFEEP